MEAANLVRDLAAEVRATALYGKCGHPAPPPSMIICGRATREVKMPIVVDSGWLGGSKGSLTGELSIRRKSACCSSVQCLRCSGPGGVTFTPADARHSVVRASDGFVAFLCAAGRVQAKICAACPLWHDALSSCCHDLPKDIALEKLFSMIKVLGSSMRRAGDISLAMDRFHQIIAGHCRLRHRDIASRLASSPELHETAWCTRATEGSWCKRLSLDSEMSTVCSAKEHSSGM